MRVFGGMDRETARADMDGYAWAMVWFGCAARGEAGSLGTGRQDACATGMCRSRGGFGAGMWFLVFMVHLFFEPSAGGEGRGEAPGLSREEGPSSFYDRRGGSDWKSGFRSGVAV